MRDVRAIKLALTSLFIAAELERKTLPTTNDGFTSAKPNVNSVIPSLCPGRSLECCPLSNTAKNGYAFVSYIRQVAG